MAEITREDLDHITDPQFTITTCERDVSITLESPVKGCPLRLAVVKNQVKGISLESAITARVLERQYYKNLSSCSVLITVTQEENSRNNTACAGMMEICGDVKRLLNEERVKRLGLFNLDEDKQEGT